MSAVARFHKRNAIFKYFLISLDLNSINFIKKHYNFVTVVVYGLTRNMKIPAVLRVNGTNLFAYIKNLMKCLWVRIFIFLARLYTFSGLILISKHV